MATRLTEKTVALHLGILGELFEGPYPKEMRNPGHVARRHGLGRAAACLSWGLAAAPAGALQLDRASPTLGYGWPLLFAPAFDPSESKDFNTLAC